MTAERDNTHDEGRWLPQEHELERMHLADAARLLHTMFVTVEREHVSCYCPTCDAVRDALGEAEMMVRV